MPSQTLKNSSGNFYNNAMLDLTFDRHQIIRKVDFSVSPSPLGSNLVYDFIGSWWRWGSGILTKTNPKKCGPYFEKNLFNFTSGSIFLLMDLFLLKKCSCRRVGAEIMVLLFHWKIKGIHFPKFEN